jgi:hypothetical protein
MNTGDILLGNRASTDSNALIYPKNVQDDLKPEQLKALKQIVEAEYHGR